MRTVICTIVNFKFLPILAIQYYIIYLHMQYCGYKQLLLKCHKIMQQLHLYLLFATSVGNHSIAYLPICMTLFSTKCQQFQNINLIMSSHKLRLSDKIRSGILKVICLNFLAHLYISRQ